MLTHLVILLDDTSVSYCHYENPCLKRKLIDFYMLNRAIVWAMKENVNIQFVYPNYQLPVKYRQLIETIDHTKIGPIGCGEDLDVVILHNLQDDGNKGKCCLWRCNLKDLEEQKQAIGSFLHKVNRLNIVLTDISQWKDSEFDTYQNLLEGLTDTICECYQKGNGVQLNLLTDRLVLDQMNNCNAGDTSVTLAPDGQFYVCPAFYPIKSIGSLDEGLHIPNKQLFQFNHAPICRICDAWQCKRCVWMNCLLTMDCNTPSHQQCVAAHIERNASRLLLKKLHSCDIKMMHMQDIKQIDYLDPFNIVNKWK